MNLNFLKPFINKEEDPTFPENPVLIPPCGPIMGIYKKGISTYKGIPYAKPPIGNLRFRPPVPNDPWFETRECFDFGSKSLQFGGILADLPSMYTTAGKSEDCLYLNVWTPATRKEDLFPVYVYIHGGGFATGSGAELMFDGTKIANRGVLVVTLNYRLGALGFLATESMMAENQSTGNNGLLDQILALKWVQENIKAFGGDPNNVTLGGESAGAFSVTALLLSPLAKNLFKRAVIESGSILSIGAFSTQTKGNLEKSIAMGQAFLDTFGIEDTPEGLAKLREVPAEAITYLSMVKADQALPLRFSFWPVYDGVVLPKDPVKALQNGEFNKADLLIGYNTDESSLFIKNNVNLGVYQLMAYTTFGAENVQKIYDHFPIDQDQKVEKQIREIFTYTGFTLGMRIIADAYSDFGLDVYFYNFNYDPAILKIVGLDTAHSLELPFVFGNAIGQLKMSKVSILSDQMQTHWTNFMKTGNPNLGPSYKNMVTWPQYQKSERELMVFDKNIRAAPMPHTEKLDFIQSLLFGDKPYYL